jgi:hypothetical protein
VSSWLRLRGVGPLIACVARCLTNIGQNGVLMELPHLCDALISSWTRLFAGQPVRELVDNDLECSHRARLHRSIRRWQTCSDQELVPQHPRKHFPLQTLLTAYRLNVPLEPRQSRP